MKIIYEPETVTVSKNKISFQDCGISVEMTVPQDYVMLKNTLFVFRSKLCDEIKIRLRDIAGTGFKNGNILIIEKNGSTLDVPGTDDNFETLKKLNAELR